MTNEEQRIRSMMDISCGEKHGFNCPGCDTAISKIVAEAERRGEVKAWEEMDKIWDLEQSRRYPLYEVMLELRGRIVKKLTSLKTP